MSAHLNACAVPDCGNAVGRHGARGWCTKHYQRWMKSGDPLVLSPRARVPPEERFWAKVDKSGPIPARSPELGPCWVWTASTDGNGYGLFSTTGRPRMRRAHLVAWEFEHGAFPSGLVADHLCRNPPCVRPSHIEPVTNQENLDRGDGRRIKMGRDNRCINGHEYTPDNTYTNKKGYKVCRRCSAEARKRYESRMTA